jgi:hypothetical protein
LDASLISEEVQEVLAHMKVAYEDPIYDLLAGAMYLAEEGVTESATFSFLKQPTYSSDLSDTSDTYRKLNKAYRLLAMIFAEDEEIQNNLQIL